MFLTLHRSKTSPSDFGHFAAQRHLRQTAILNFHNWYHRILAHDTKNGSWYQRDFLRRCMLATEIQLFLASAWCPAPINCATGTQAYDSAEPLTWFVPGCRAHSSHTTWWTCQNRIVTPLDTLPCIAGKIYDMYQVVAVGFLVQLVR